MLSRPRRCVLLFSRPPRAEARAKNLAGAEAVFALACRRVGAAAERIGADLVVAAPRGSGGAFAGAHLLEQRGDGFAERVRNAFADAQALGYAEILAVPGDVPGLTARALLRARAVLQTAAVVLGPCPDGGVYLLGVRGPVDALLSGVRWRTRHVLRDLRRAAPAARVLFPLCDLDAARDIANLARAADPELAAVLRSLRAARPEAAPRLVPVARPRVRGLPPRAPPAPLFV